MAKVIIPAEGARKQIVIYANYIESINAFLSTPLVDADLGEYEIRTKSVSGHQRRKGPSDQTPINVLQRQVRYLVDPTLKSGNAKPGFSFILKTDMRFADVDMQRRFTMTGTVRDFKDYFNKRMKYDTFYYPSCGGRHKLYETPIGDG
jgi:hypothetical protein